MRRRVCISVLCLLWIVAPLLGQAAPDGTPERAIQDMLLASDPPEVEKHLPLSTLQAIKTLDPADRQELEATLIWRKRVPGGADIQLPEDGQAFLILQYSPETKAEARLDNSLITGAEAVLRFTQEEPFGGSHRVVVWMRYEEDEWRLYEVDLPGWEFRFDDPEFVERFRHSLQKDNESAAISTLYTISYSLQSFAQARPDIGFPDDLSVLELIPGESDDSDSDQPTGFLSADLAHNDFVRDGYNFRYQLLRAGPQGAYSLTARPTDQKAGRFSYFINESGGLRQTDEDRDATAEDPPAP